MSGQDTDERQIIRDAFDTIQGFIFDSTDRINTNEYVQNMGAIQTIYNKMSELYPSMFIDAANNPDEDQYVPEGDDAEYYIQHNDENGVGVDEDDDDDNDNNVEEDEDEDEEEDVDMNQCRCADFIKYRCKRTICSIVKCNAFAKLFEDFPVLELVKAIVIDEEECDKVFDLQMTVAEFQIEATEYKHISKYLKKFKILLNIIDKFTAPLKLIIAIGIFNHIIKTIGHVDIIKHKPSAIRFLNTTTNKIESYHQDEKLIRRFNRIRHNFNVDFPFPQWLDEFRRIVNEVRT
jgi:hypothetical protein